MASAAILLKIQQQLRQGNQMASKYSVYSVCRSGNGNIFKKHPIDIYEAKDTKESMF